MDKKRVDIRNVAKEAGVSIATVSRVLNNTEKVRESTRKKVLESVEKLGYRQNAIAKSLRSKTTQYIGIIVPEIEHEYFTIIAKWIENLLQQYDYGVFIVSIEGNNDKAIWYTKLFLDHAVQGIVSLVDNADVIKLIQKAGIPLVIADRIEKVEDLGHVSYVGSDNAEGGKIAGFEMARRKVNKIAIMRDKREILNVNERVEGILSALNDSGYQKGNIRILNTKIDREYISEVLNKNYEQWPFDGLICTSDYIALTAMASLLHRGLKIPEDVQVIGYDGIPSVNYFYPTLSTVTQDLQAMGEKIGQIMHKMLLNSSYTEYCKIPVEFVKGGSIL